MDKEVRPQETREDTGISLDEIGVRFYPRSKALRGRHAERIIRKANGCVRTLVGLDDCFWADEIANGVDYT